MGSTYLPTLQIKWELPGGIHDSKFSSFGRSLFPRLGVSVITESTAKTVAAQPKSLDSLAKVVLVIGKPLIVF